jgi:xylulokinase
VRPKRFTVVGGGTRNALWLRLLASAIGRPLGLIEGADLAGPRGAAKPAAVAGSGPISILGDGTAPTGSVHPDLGLATALSDRQEKTRQFLWQ